jgi:hypothetical protein
MLCSFENIGGRPLVYRNVDVGALQFAARDDVVNFKHTNPETRVTSIA